MSTLKVDNIQPYSAGTVTIQGLDITGYATTGSNTFVGDQTVSGSITTTTGITTATITGSAGLTIDTQGVGTVNSSGDITFNGTGAAGKTAKYIYNMDSAAVAQFIVRAVDGVTNKGQATIQGNYSDGLGYIAAYGDKGRVDAFDNTTFEGTISIFADNAGGYIDDFSPVTNDYSHAIKFQPFSSYNNGLVEVLRPLDVSGSITLRQGITSVGGLTINAPADVTITNSPVAEKDSVTLFNTDSATLNQVRAEAKISGSQVSRAALESYYNNGLGRVEAVGTTARVEAYDNTFEGTVGIYADSNGSYIQDFSAITNDYSNAIKFQPYSVYNGGLVEVLRPLEVSGSATFNQVIQLTALDPLPAGALGQLAVSGSDLYFHNGTNWVLK